MKKLFFLLPLVLLAWCTMSKTWDWTCFYYPNEAKTIRDNWAKVQSNFTSLDACISRAENMYKTSWAKTYTSQCWYKCKYIPEVDMYQCKYFK